MVAGALSALAGGLAIRTNDLHLQVVLSGSMQPAFSAGDVAVTSPIPVERLAVGDVIAFYPPGEARPVLHRITSLQSDAGGPTITSRGDANGNDDPWRATLRGSTAYRLVAVVPFVGWLTQVRGVALIAGGLLMALVLIREIKRKETMPGGPGPA